MKQPIKKTNRIAKKKKQQKNPKGKAIKGHPMFGTSKLEQDFATDFLDKLGVKYIWQYEAKDIGRFFDYYLPEHNILIEVDGSYFHSDPRVVDENKLNPMQKHNKRVDDYKNKWALLHGIPLVRVLEEDIRKNPKEVMKKLKERLYIAKDEEILKEGKNKRHKNKIK